MVGKVVTETRTLHYPKGLMSPEDLVDFHKFPVFAKQWARLGLNETDLRALELLIMINPNRAPIMAGTGGLRKIRFVPPDWNTGKSGALRICYSYSEFDNAVLLVSAYAKREKATPTAAEKRQIKTMLKTAWKRTL